MHLEGQIDLRDVYSFQEALEYRLQHGVSSGSPLISPVTLGQSLPLSWPPFLPLYKYSL